MIEMASWGGSDLKNLQFLVPKVSEFIHLNIFLTTERDSKNFCLF